MSNKTRSVQNRDVFSRMNFLYQASMLMAGNHNSLSAYYGALCKSIGKKCVLRMEPNIKRTLCKKCGLSMKPGVTSKIDIDERHKYLFTMQCKKCNFKKNFLINSNYTFWLDNPQSIAEIYNFTETTLEIEANNLTLKDKKINTK